MLLIAFYFYLFPTVFHNVCQYIPDFYANLQKEKPDRTTFIFFFLSLFRRRNSSSGGSLIDKKEVLDTATRLTTKAHH